MSIVFQQNINKLKKSVQQTESFTICKKDTVTCQVLDILWSYGFILGYKNLKQKNLSQNKLQIFLKFWGSKSILHNLKLISKPQKRVFIRWQHLIRVYSRHELLILSTTRGVLSHHDCIKLGLGGEVLCVIA